MSSPAQESDSYDSPSQESDRTGRHNNETGDNNSDSSDSDNSDRSNDNNRPPLFVHKMLNLCKEITIMVLIAVVYAALTNETPPKVSKSPAAYPFFSKDSLVTDWYKGQITEAIENARSSDIAFVMFYAPWDAESQTARKQFELAAEIMHEQVTFAGINCWQPGSECRRQYSKVYKWPVLIAYPTHGRGIQYNGPLEAFHMVKFLQNICTPVVRCQKIEELYGKYDTIVTGNVNLLPGSYEYAVFYSTAMRVLERDPFRDVAFAVLPQYNTTVGVQLHMWNATIEYDGEWNAESMSAWVLKNMRQIVSWLTPTGMKSLTMSSFIQPGPTIFLFTPKNPLYDRADLYDMLRVVAYDYYNCNNDSRFITRQKLINIERSKSRKNYDNLKQICLPKQEKEVVANLPNIWTNNTMKNICNCVTAEWSKVCQENEDSYPKLSAKYLIRNSLIERECQQFLLAQKYSPIIFETTSPEDNINLRGLACKTNVTLTFVALDSLRYYYFAEKFGVGLERSDKSGLVIIDEKMETHHVLEKTVTYGNVRHFIKNFTQKTLSRSLRSRARSKNQHVYPHLTCPKREQLLFCVEELTSDNFLQTIMQSDKVIIVFYYSKQCSFCNGVSHAFLTVAKILSSVEEIKFVRIDGDVNLLPWEYTMETYPTILFMPARRKSESRIFPKNVQIAVPNLVGFILTNVEPVLKLKTMWFLCLQAKFVDEKIKCFTSVRVETLTIINKTLKEWRNSKHKHQILYKLQLLRHLHVLLLSHSPQISDIQMCLRKLRD